MSTLGRHCYPAQISQERADRALERAYDCQAEAVVERLLIDEHKHSVAIGTVTALDGRTFTVRSYDLGDEQYIDCSCGNTKTGNMCWHVAAFIEAEEIQEEIPEPTPVTDLLQA